MSEMAIYRNIQTSFWTDSKVVDDFDSDDKLFYLYLMTNPYTNLAGCYQISISHVSLETGFSKDKVKKLLEKASKELNTIRYDQETNEILILKWSNYNWTNSEKFRKPLLVEIERVRNESFKSYLMDIFNGIDTVSDGYTYGIDTVSIGYEYGIDTPCSVSDTVSVTDSVLSEKEIGGMGGKEKTKEVVVDSVVKEIVDYLNDKAGKYFKAKTRTTMQSIHGRIADGYTIDDFKKVIDTKVAEWKGTDYEKYLTPETLFRPSKFEKYLNQSTIPINQPREKPPNKTDWSKIV